MMYLVKIAGTHAVVEAKCNTFTRWTKMDRSGYSYEYNGVGDFVGIRFETTDIIAKGRSKKNLEKKHAELLI